MSRFVLGLCCLAAVAVGQYTDVPVGKYASRAIKEITEEMFSVDADGNHNGTCDYGINLMWHTQAESSIFATPLITDLFSDGKRDILVPTATHYVEGLDGLTGRDVGRFPFVHPKLHSQSSILAVDLDHDGVTEYMISTTNGELVFITEDGTPIHGKTIRVPGVAINRDWHLSKPKQQAKRAADMHPAEKQAKEVFDRMALQPYPKKQEPPAKLGGKDSTVPAPTVGRRLLADELPQDDYQEEYEGADGYYDRLYSDPEDADAMAEEEEEEQASVEIGPDSHISPEARASMDLVYHPALYRSSVNVDPEKDLFKPMNNVHPKLLDTQVEVDAHILSTPVVVDIDADGHLDAVISVSYYYDVESYHRNGREVPVDDPDNYVASGVVCIDLVTGVVKWSHLLHVTTKHTTYPAYALSSPLFINIDSDLTLDVFITTTQGLVIGFDAKGAEKPGWPVSMGPIMGSPIAADVNGDGQADICAVDILGSIGCFNHKGVELFDFQLPGSVVSTPIAADINGDGILDLAVGTTSGLLFAVDVFGRAVLPHFPVVTGGPIVVTPLAVRLKKMVSLAGLASLMPSRSAMELVVPSSDGYVYIVSADGCFEVIDLGEKSFSMVLADDITGNGKLDLIVTTVSGSVNVFETSTPFHPLKQWLSKPHSINGFTASVHVPHDLQYGVCSPHRCRHHGHESVRV